MAHAELASPGGPICTWTEASRKFAIHLSPEVIARLGTESWIAFKRVPRRGLEIGGILLGRTDSRDDTTTFWIEGSVPVESEHKSGPSYVLSESDFGRLQEALTRNKAAIGLYRSQTRSEQLISQEPDVQLFGRCFDRDALFLMLGPVPGVAAFFIWADGNLKCVHQFPLASSLSSSLALRRRDASPQVDLPAQPATEIQVAPPLSVADDGLDHQPSPQNQDPPEETSSPDVSGQRLDPHRPLKTALKMKFRAEREAPGTAAVPIPSSALSGSGDIKWNIAARRWLVRLSDASRTHSAGVTKKAWVLAAAFALVLAATGGVLSYFSPHAAAPLAAALLTPAPVGRAPEFIRLNVERTGSSLRIFWDRNSSALRGATRAVLHIQDGDSQSDRDLAPSEFDAGSVTYEPKSSEFTFRLDAYSAGPNATGLVQVLNLSPQPAPAPDRSAAPKLPPAPKQPASTLLPAPAFAARTELVSAHPPAMPDERPDGKKVEKKEEEILSAATRSPERIETSSLDTRDAPAPIVVEPPPQRLAIPAERAAPISGRVSGREPSVHVLAEPVLGSRWGHLVGKVPVLRRLRKPEKFTEPVPVFQAQPTVRMPDHQSLIRPVSVGVKVYVAESGAVQSAEVVEYGEPPDFKLANAALAAARLWTFEPARLEDAPVSSEVILRFHFTP
jgi:hypothetical protein